MSVAPESSYPSFVNTSVQLVLAEYRQQHQAHLADSEGLDRKAVSLLGWASVAVTVVSAVNLPDIISKSPICTGVLLGVVGALYLLVMSLGLWAFAPAKYEMPIGTDYKKVRDRLLTVDEDQALEQIFLQYLGVIERNRTRVDSKAYRLQWAIRLLPVLVVALSVLVAQPLWAGCLP